MNATIYDIIGQLVYGEVKEKTATIGMPPSLSSGVRSVSYILDIVNCGPHLFDSVLHTVKAIHRLTDNDRLLPFAIDSIDEGVDLCRQFCIEQDLPFQQADEARLRKNIHPTEPLLLYIIERPHYQ